MPVTVVVGGQFGSEGKGKVVHFLAEQMNASSAVRVGGINSGHTILSNDGRPHVFRQLPTAAVLPNVHCFLPAGSYIYPPLLQQEILEANIGPDRLIIDPNAMVIERADIELERNTDLPIRIGSTSSGTGAAVLRRIHRMGRNSLASEAPMLQQFIQPVTSNLVSRLAKGERIIVEGTQGFGLSLLHSSHYPYVTSRDTTAASFVSEAGLSPLDVDDVVVVIRAFPIRVGGNSGPLLDEISWQTIKEEGAYEHSLAEFTTVTKRLRRVARFDPNVVRQAIAHNRPTRIVLNHLDYLDASANKNITPVIQNFVRTVEESLDKKIDLLGLGPSTLVTPTPRLKIEVSK